MFDRDTLKSELIRDEGCVFEIYEDHLGYATCGVGHLIIEGDPEHGKPIGTEVSPDEVNAYLEKDIDTAIVEVSKRYPFFASLDDVRQRVLINMTFNLGSPRLSMFKKFLAAVEAGNWHVAAAEMLDSKWAKQVGDRAIRLSDMMRDGTV
ncbi:MAG: lysozyme [Idiomarina sp.]|nr:lysozyme [Idiomarina sp.]